MINVSFCFFFFFISLKNILLLLFNPTYDYAGYPSPVADGLFSVRSGPLLCFFRPVTSNVIRFSRSTRTLAVCIYSNLVNFLYFFFFYHFKGILQTVYILVDLGPTAGQNCKNRRVRRISIL